MKNPSIRPFTPEEAERIISTLYPPNAELVRWEDDCPKEPRFQVNDVLWDENWGCPRFLAMCCFSTKVHRLLRYADTKPVQHKSASYRGEDGMETIDYPIAYRIWVSDSPGQYKQELQD